MEGDLRCPYLVGREREWALLRAAIDAAARHRRGGTVLVAGVGKSRQVREAAGEAMAAGLPVVWGRTAAGGSPVPFRPVIEVVMAALRLLPVAATGDADRTAVVGLTALDTLGAAPAARRVAAMLLIARGHVEARPDEAERVLGAARAEAGADPGALARVDGLAALAAIHSDRVETARHLARGPSPSPRRPAARCGL